MRERDIIKNKTIMWSKIKEMSEQSGYSNSKIARELGIHRQTVSKYLSMSEPEYFKWLNSTHSRSRKLDVYTGYVRGQLERDPTLSAAAIHDRLREQFPTLPQVSEKTVYNFVERCRRSYDLPKRAVPRVRQYERREETPYGEYAQVDFGEQWMAAAGGVRHKVRFMVMVLCRSRQKFYWYQSKSFTAADAVRAHDAAFEYFGGQPRKIIYDQDSVFLHRENLGDLILTNEFQSYVSQMNFEPVFCRPADPESKGMVENCVRYAKENFLRGREWRSDAELNALSAQWLERTGNGKVHSSTHLVPKEEWETERSFLIPVKPHQRVGAPDDFQTRKVLKDNTLIYKSSFYSLPLGTYAGHGTTVRVQEAEGRLTVSDMSGVFIAEHTVSAVPGAFVKNTSHSRDRTATLQRDIEAACSEFPETEVRLLLEAVGREKPRYLHDSVRILRKGLEGIPGHIRAKAAGYCLENNLLNTATLSEVARKMAEDERRESEALVPSAVPSPSVPTLSLIPQSRGVNAYNVIINYRP